MGGGVCATRCVRGYIARRREMRRGLDVELTLEKVAVDSSTTLAKASSSRRAGERRRPDPPIPTRIRGEGCRWRWCRRSRRWRVSSSRAQLLKATRASEGVSAVAAVVEENGHVSLLETDVTVELGEAFGD